MASPVIWVATRKGLFAVRKGSSGWALGSPRFPGEPVSQFARDAKTGDCYAALRLGHFGVKLWKGTDGGEWKDDATPWTVDMVWGLHADGGTLWAGCLPAGLFKSTDGGASWQLQE